ncbi:MAG: hypothetical protein HYW15_02220 [Candidatus Giovannonibacteria bacterium]|nr:MAG: hypothetical protein HYW15_02220 [Candidatus Giovannonibacteria bacterium]
MDCHELCFVPHPKEPGSYVLRLRGLTEKEAAGLDKDRLCNILDQVAKSALLAKKNVRKNPELLKQFIDIPTLN